ncbi:MAG: hypothetical protein ACO1OC_06115 [Tuberibacillus sp.]
MKTRFSVMERQWVSGMMRLVIMDWEKAEIITLMLNDLDDEHLDKELISFINEMRPVLERPLWKSYDSLHNDLTEKDQ